MARYRLSQCKKLSVSGFVSVQGTFQNVARLQEGLEADAGRVVPAP